MLSLCFEFELNGQIVIASDDCNFKNYVADDQHRNAFSSGSINLFPILTKKKYIFFFF
jgi:hypothetical protein